MAKDIGAPPALLARNVLEKHCGKDEFNGNLNTIIKIFIILIILFEQS